MADKESDGEETFHSAGEEDIGTPPSHTVKEKPDGPVAVNPKDGTSEKEPKSAGKTAAKKPRGKKGKKKKASALDEKGDKDSKDVAHPDADTVAASSPQSRKPGLESSDDTSEHKPQEEIAKPNACKSKTEAAKTVEDDPHQSPADENADQTPSVKESLMSDPDTRTDAEASDAKGQDDSSSKLQEIKGEPSEETEVPISETKSEDPEREERGKHPREDDEPLSDAGQKVIAETKSESSAADDDASSSKQPDAEDSSGEKSFSGAFGRLTGEQPQEKKASGGGWGWGGWGSSFVSSVSAVGHGLSSVIENVETSLGLPKPQELTDQEKREQQFVVTSDKQEDGAELKEEDGDGEEKADAADDEETTKKEAEVTEDKGEEKQDEAAQADQSKSPSAMKGFLSFGATAITSVVGKTVTGGLDALETIGRKTMDVLQEGNHGAVKGSGRGQKGNLSEILKDAKEEAETAAQLEEEEREQQRAHFGILFDQYQGLAHLEALEMLSNQSESKVQGSLSMCSGEDLQGLKTELIEIRDAFQLEDLESEEQAAGSEQDFVNAITEHLFGVSIASTPDKLQRVQRSAHEWLMDCKSQQEAGQKQDIKELHIKAIETLAEFSSRVIEQFHKACELMLLPQDKEHSKSPVQRATSLSKLTSVLVSEVSNQAAKFADCLNQEATNSEDVEASDVINPLITNIYLEASNSTSYIQDAFQLVLPILQMVAIDRKNDVESQAT